MVFAWIALARGEIDEAFEWLDRAYQDRNPLLLQIGVVGLYDPIRDDPRFAALLKKVGLDGVVPGGMQNRGAPPPPLLVHSGHMG